MKKAKKKHISIHLLYSFTMKALAFVSIFICLLNIAVGLKCYKCDDTNYYYNMLPDDVDMSCVNQIKRQHVIVVVSFV